MRGTNFEKNSSNWRRDAAESTMYSLPPSLHWSIKCNFFFVPRTSIGELSSTFYAELRYVYIIFISGRISKIQRNLNVQNSTLRAHETGRNVPLKCWGLWLSPVFGVRYIPLQCPAIVCQHTWGPLALVPLFHSHNILAKSFSVFVTDLPRFSGKIPSVTPESGFSDSYCVPQLCTKSTGPVQHPNSSLLCDFLRSLCKSS